MLTPEPLQKHIAAHPLCPITASEIKRAADLMRNLYPSKTDLHFKAITLEEPEKAQLVPYLEAEHSGGRLPRIDRKAYVSYYIRNTVSLNRNCYMNGPRTILTWKHRTNSTKLSSIFHSRK